MPTEFDVIGAVRAGQYEHDKVREHLDQLTTAQVLDLLGNPRWRNRQYAGEARHWKVGDGRPALADEEPAVMQAIGRCAASRVRGANVPDLGIAIHPQTCGWCEYPTEELMAACEWSAHHAQFLVVDLLIWAIKDDGPQYVRSTGTEGEYQNPRWRTFWHLPASTRAFQIERAQYPAAVAR